MSDEQNQVSKSGGGSMFGRLADGLREAIFEEGIAHTAPESPKSASSESTYQAPSNSIEKNPMQERLHQSVMARNTGFAQLISNIQALETIIPDDAARLRAAFAVLQKNGLSLPSLMQEIELHFRDLETQVLRFRDEAATERKQRIDVREKTCTEKKAMIDKVRAEMARQQKMLADEEAKLAELSAEIQKQTADLDLAAEHFAAAVENEKSWLLQQSSRIKALFEPAA